MERADGRVEDVVFRAEDVVSRVLLDVTIKVGSSSSSVTVVVVMAVVGLTSMTEMVVGTTCVKVVGLAETVIVLVTVGENSITVFVGV